MTALTDSIPFNQNSKGPLAYISVPVYAAAIIWGGAMVARRSATDGYAVPASASTGPVIGVAAFAVNATGLASGAQNVHLLQGVFARPNSTTNPVTQDHIGMVVYAEDDNTIGSKPGAGCPAGICNGLDADGNVLVEIAANPANAQVTGELPIPLAGTILAAGTPMAAFADNAASNPGVTLANSKAFGIRWNNAASQVAVYGGFVLPNDIDLTSPITVKARCSKVGATAGDLTTFDIALYPQTVGALHDAGASAGGTTSACTNSATKTVQEVSVTVDATKIGVAGDTVTFSVKPTDGTLGTDDMVLHSLKLVYKRKQLLS